MVTATQPASIPPRSTDAPAETVAVDTYDLLCSNRLADVLAVAAAFGGGS